MNEETPVDMPAEQIEEVTPPVASAPEENSGSADAQAQMKRISRRSFLWSVVALGAGAGGLRWLDTRRTEDGIPWPLRRALQNNESLARDWSDYSKLAPTFPRTAVTDERVNGDIGLGEDFNPSQWALQVIGLATGETLSLGLDDIKKLPRHEMITEFKCIEGWSTITGWAGARLADFVAKFPPSTASGEPFDLKKPGDWPEYVGLETPDGQYYVGLEMPAALHPQTLLAYEVNGKPLTLEHGAPLRLVTPLKYGVKNIKRIGTITYTGRRPRDYWAEQGYDWYAGH
jgi:hypothetical protein